MLSKNQIIDKAYELGFADIGFTSAEPFESQIKILQSRQEEYAWLLSSGIDLMSGIDPKKVYPKAKSIIVLIEAYFNEAFPPSLEGHFGRCYLDDNRMTKDGSYLRIKAFRQYLRDNGIESSIPQNLPHRVAAARAGLGDFGKNCLLYSHKVARGGSWILPIPIVVDYEFIADDPTYNIGCPKWCKNVCIIACPTGALKGPRKIDPRKCISYLTYFGENLTPKELREPMGLWVYGCDCCQNVCPRNKPWLAQELPLNKRVAAKEKNFDLRSLIHMDKKYYRTKIWQHMFYMPITDIWRWKMNVARAMGNSLEPKYIPDLIEAFHDNKDERVKSMCAWALGRIGGSNAKVALQKFLSDSEGKVKDEILEALEKI